MSTKEQLKLREDVLGVLAEHSLLNAKELQECLDNSLRGDIEYTRYYLLELVQGLASSCTFCRRHKNRVRSAVYDGPLDVPMIVTEHNTSIDTLSGVPSTGLPEAIRACGGCAHFKEHYTPFLDQAASKPPHHLDKITCVKCSFKESVEILPRSFHRQGRALPLWTEGQVLSRLLLDLGQKRSSWWQAGSIYITSALLCPSNTGSKGDAVACRTWLNLQIQIAKPPIIICLGEDALNSVYKTTYKDAFGKLTKTPSFLLGATLPLSKVLDDILKGSEDSFDTLTNHFRLFLQ